MREAIMERVSRRTFTGEPFSETQIKKIMELVDKANELSGLTMEFLEDGSDAFNSFRKSYGMFKNVRSLLIMKGNKDDENLYEKVGYYGESIILDLTDMGIGSCWVGGTFDKSKFTCDPEEEITCVVVIGNIGEITLRERMIRSAISKKRKAIDKRLISSVEIPQWMREGMEAVRLAPSAVNMQKPTFHYDGTTLTADVKNDYFMDFIDLGIAKLHFEIGAGGKFQFGNGAKYEI